MTAIPDRVSLEGLEPKWDTVWEQRGTYRFDRSRPRQGVFSVDTPPPTVSGQLHLGTVFGYVQVDSVVRFHRMRGDATFYPVGWDDNGLPTERRVQNHFGVRCDPTLPYDPDLVVPDPGDDRKRVSRPNFLQLCHQLTAVDEAGFEEVFRRVGLSVDWSYSYATIDDRSRRVAQRAFLRNLARDEAYAAEAPTLWDVDYQTAVAQAELEDRAVAGTFHRLRFARADGDGAVDIETTRPELLAACVALVAHPDDERYRDLIGSEVITPVFGVRVPVLAHAQADPDKGSGLVMVCTFGDTLDVVWWRELQLPTRTIVQRTGTLADGPLPWLSGDGTEAYATVAGLHVKRARAQVVALLQQAGALVGEPRAIEHEVRFYEKGDRPLEIVSSRQWYIRNGARDPGLRQALLQAGRSLQWHPEFMRVRYEHWVAGLNTDWLISRQRFFGVPFPVWYPVGADGEARWEEPIAAGEDALPVDPQVDCPPGYSPDQRGAAGGFVGDPDVMDTWATSSLTPQIACGWEEDDDLFARTFPMDLRPQGPEIIRTWLFSTVLRAHAEHGTLPWSDTSINGWILDPDRKKMSKSKGNVVTPEALVERYGADGLRYWACSGAPGIDTAVDEGQMRVGRRLAIKLLNVTKFIVGTAGTEAGEGTPTDPVDLAMLAGLGAVAAEATAAFDAYQYQRALERIESFFWSFCDDFIELVKTRAYGDGPGATSARRALHLAVDHLLRLLAPFLPFACEEAWSWWHDGSVHLQSWPDGSSLPTAAGDPQVLAMASEVLGAIRKAKTEARLSMRAPVAQLVVIDTPARLALLRSALDDIRDAGAVGDTSLMELAADAEPSVVVTLAEPGPEAGTPAAGDAAG